MSRTISSRSRTNDSQDCGMGCETAQGDVSFSSTLGVLGYSLLPLAILAGIVMPLVKSMALVDIAIKVIVALETFDGDVSPVHDIRLTQSDTQSV